MSKEIVIKSPIKILTNRSNCTQLNEGEIGIYQPPFRYKNEDGTLGDLKCKKVQMYTKINGEIKKTNTYKPTGIIHHKSMPFDARCGEIYYCEKLYCRLPYRKDESKIIRLPLIDADLFDKIALLYDSTGNTRSILYSVAMDIKKTHAQFIIDFPDNDYTCIVKSRYSSKIKESISFNMPKDYYMMTQTKDGKMLVKVRPNANMPHSRKGIRLISFRKKRKLLFGLRFSPIDIECGFKKYRYVMSGGYGLVAEFYCKKRRSKRHPGRPLKRVNLPPNYFRRLKNMGGVAKITVEKSTI